MSRNILVTGAAGYIGGSIVADFAQRQEGALGQSKLFALVRSEEQARSFSSLPSVTVVRADLKKEESIVGAILEHQIDFVVNTATCLDKDVLLSLIKGLSQQQQVSGQPGILMHTSGASSLDKATGWPHDPPSDDDALYELEKAIRDTYIIRDVDVFTIDQAAAHGVTLVTMLPVNVYGRGLGPWNQLSIHFPGQIKASMKLKKVHKFAEEKSMPLVHITDLTEYYARLAEALIRQEDVPAGKTGYYMVISHSTSWWDILDGFAKSLHDRGLVDASTPDVWQSDKAAAEAYEMPVQFAHSIFNSGVASGEGSSVTSANKKYINWEPEWDNARFIKELDSEVRDALELDTSRTSLLRAIESESKRMGA